MNKEEIEKYIALTNELQSEFDLLRESDSIDPDVADHYILELGNLQNFLKDLIPV